jgi:hypothetical protein
MKTLRTSFGLKGIAFVMLAGLLTANCSSKSNPTPGNTAGTGGHAGTTGTAGTTGAAGTTGNAGTGGAGTSGGAGTTGAAGTGSDGGAGTGAGDGSAPCDASGLVQEAGCMACATDPLFGCSTVNTTCIPFNNSSIPANIPRL